MVFWFFCAVLKINPGTIPIYIPMCTNLGIFLGIGLEHLRSSWKAKIRRIITRLFIAYKWSVVGRSISFVDRLPIFGNASLILKQVTVSFLPYLAGETREEKPCMNGDKQLATRDFDKMFPTLVDDLVEHAKEYGVPKDTLDWYQNVGSSFFLL